MPSKPTQGVEVFLAALAHPLKPEIVALSRIILGVDPGILEEIKWNAPSFRTSEHFATLHLRAKDCVQLILHLGARKRNAVAMAIDDPDGLLEWLGPDRATIRFADMEDINTRRRSVEHVIVQWIRHV